MDLGPAAPSRFMPRGNTQRSECISSDQSIDLPVMTTSSEPMNTALVHASVCGELKAIRPIMAITPCESTANILFLIVTPLFLGFSCRSIKSEKKLSVKIYRDFYEVSSSVLLISDYR